MEPRELGLVDFRKSGLSPRTGGHGAIVLIDALFGFEMGRHCGGGVITGDAVESEVD